MISSMLKQSWSQPRSSMEFHFARSFMTGKLIVLTGPRVVWHCITLLLVELFPCVIWIHLGNYKPWNLPLNVAIQPVIWYSRKIWRHLYKTICLYLWKPPLSIWMKSSSVHKATFSTLIKSSRSSTSGESVLNTQTYPGLPHFSHLPTEASYFNFKNK